jgi:hypothetical protein
MKWSSGISLYIALDSWHWSVIYEERVQISNTFSSIFFYSRMKLVLSISLLKLVPLWQLTCPNIVLSDND